VTGEYGGEATFEGSAEVHRAESNYEPFLACYASGGSLRWVRDPITWDGYQSPIKVPFMSRGVALAVRGDKVWLVAGYGGPVPSFDGTPPRPGRAESGYLVAAFRR
jgi:hypothetical protein